MRTLRQRARLCLLSLVTTSFALGQVAYPEEIERLNERLTKCEINIEDARKLAESIAKSAEQKRTRRYCSVPMERSASMPAGMQPESLF
jgi:hypothetical protein